MRSLHFSTLLAITMTLFSTVRAQNNNQTTVGGYGELHYNEPDGSRRGMLDFHRFVLYFGHNFNEQISFRSELELEHTKIEAGDPDGGEIAIEQAYLDYRFHERIGLRAGIVLIPVGLTNLYHEPPTFHGVERPNVERNIIPTTWRESGAGVYGTIGGEWNYQLYVLAGLKAEGFSAGSGIRGGRQSGFESNPGNPSLTGRISVTPTLDLQLGGSFYFGNATAGEDSIGNATVALWSIDARYNIENFQFKALGAIAFIGDAEKINRRFGGRVGDQIYGFYLEGAYNFMPLLCSESEQQLFAFTRFERYDTQSSTTGFSATGQNNRNDIIIGLTYKPTFNTSFKFDYTFLNNNGPVGNTKQLNLGIGYFFN